MEALNGQSLRLCGERLSTERPALALPMSRNQLMPGRSSGLLAKQPIVVGMTANPKPDQPVRYFGREGTIVSADADRPGSPPTFLT